MRPHALPPRAPGLKQRPGSRRSHRRRGTRKAPCEHMVILTFTQEPLHRFRGGGRRHVDDGADFGWGEEDAVPRDELSLVPNGECPERAIARMQLQVGLAKRDEELAKVETLGGPRIALNDDVSTTGIICYKD
ncbi:hypothetical protein Esti_000909 [Eimeria stiedai]